MTIKTNNKTEEKEILTLVNKLNNPSDRFLSKSTENLLTKIGIYSLNIGSRLLCEAYNAKESIGNFYGALGFATLDVLAQKNSKFKRLTKFGGYLFYVGSCGYDLISGLNDFDNIWPHLGNFALDVTMAYQLGKDTGSLYKELKDNKEDEKSGLSKDLEGVVSFFKEKTDNLNKKTESIKIKFKDYFSAFGKGIGQGVSYGALAGYSFGYSAFETLKENYSAYRKKQKEKSEIKRLENEKKKKENEEQKIKEQEGKKIKDALEKIRKANKKKMEKEKDEINQIKYGG